MRRTYAYNGIYIGFLLGLWVGLSTKNTVIGVVVGIASAIAIFVIIRLIENLIRKGVDKVVDGISGKSSTYEDGEAGLNGQKNILDEKANDKDWICSKCGKRVAWYSVNCECGNTKLKSVSEKQQ